MAGIRPGSKIERGFPVLNGDGQNTDPDGDELPVGRLLWNGSDSEIAVVVERTGVGLFKYTTYAPAHGLTGDDIQVEMSTTVDAIPSTDFVDEFVIEAVTSSGSSGSYTPGGDGSLDDLAIIRPETSTYDGCEIFDKLRVLTSPEGNTGTIEWQLTNPAGVPISLASPDSISVSGDNDVSVQVLFFGCAGCEAPVGPVEAEIYDAEAGVIRYDIPEAIADYAGIYTVQMGLIRESKPDRPFYIQKAILSVERSGWGAAPTDGGPPTINEIRTMLRDNAVENVYRSAVEYSVDEVLTCVMMPIMEWNETPPPVAFYSCRNFPYRFHWIRAIVAELMRIASQHYLRNKMNTSTRGMSIADMDKNEEYMKLSELYRRAFMEHKKVQINMELAWGTVSSPYSGLPGR